MFSNCLYLDKMLLELEDDDILPRLKCGMFGKLNLFFDSFLCTSASAALMALISHVSLAQRRLLLSRDRRIISLRSLNDRRMDVLGLKPVFGELLALLWLLLPALLWSPGKLVFSRISELLVPAWDWILLLSKRDFSSLCVGLSKDLRSDSITKICIISSGLKSLSLFVELVFSNFILAGNKPVSTVQSSVTSQPVEDSSLIRLSCFMMRGGWL